MTHIYLFLLVGTWKPMICSFILIQF